MQNTAVPNNQKCKMVSSRQGMLQEKNSLKTRRHSLQGGKENFQVSTDELPGIKQNSGVFDAVKMSRMSSAPTRPPQRRLSLPQIAASSTASQGITRDGRNKKMMPKPQRRISLPVIETKNVIFTHVLKVNHENEDTVEQGHYLKENVRPSGNGVDENRRSDSQNDERVRKLSTQSGARSIKRRDSTHHATVFTPASRDRRRSSFRPDFDISRLNTTENEKVLNEPLEEDGEKQLHLGNDFKRTGNVVGKAALLAKFLGDDFNTRYLYATLHDPDYNDKYHRLPTPEIETDEEKEDEILKDFADRLADAIDSPTEQTDKDRDADSEESSESQMGEENHETDETDSEQSLIQIDEVPEELRDLIDLGAINKPNEDDILLELGIWKAEDFNQNEDADDEKSEDDWSIKTFEDNQEEENEILDFPASPLPPPPTPPKPITPPYMIKLPRGDTADILRLPTPSESDTPSSSYSVYASEFDEYESDVFGTRIQENLFFVPQSLQSDAGDSDIFYCVPKPVVELTDASTSSEQKTADKNTEKTKEIFENKKRRRKTRRELNENFVRNFMAKHKVQDVTIQQFGGATKAFRLRMAKLGKDPIQEDCKRNEKIEKRVRRRLERSKRKRKQLTKENVIKLPNVSKKAKVMRWINVQRKGQNTNSNVVFENGWMGNDVLQSSIRIVDGDFKKTLKKRESMRMRSIDDEASPTPQKEAQVLQKEAQMPKNEVMADFNKANVNEKKKNKKKRFRKKQRKREREIEAAKSEESFTIIKNIDIKILRKENDENESDFIEDVSPESVKSHDEKTANSISCDSDDSNLPAESPSPPDTKRQRFPTPESEPEPKPEINQSDDEEKQQDLLRQQEQKRKRAASLNWKLLHPRLRLGKRRESFNQQLSDIKRILFSQLTLKAKDYSKLPPIRNRSRVTSSFATNKSGRSTRRRETPISPTNKQTKNYSVHSSPVENNV